MNAKQNPLLGSYSERIARTFARRDGIRVRIEGSGTPYADLVKNEIVIPSTIDALDPKARRAFDGVLDHETAHLRAESEHADLPASALMRTMTKRQRWLFNVVEDVRIEIDAEARWPGVKTNLRACADWAFERIETSLASGKAQGGFLFGAGLIARARGWEDLMSDLWPADALALLDKFDWAVTEARALKTPAEAADLALRIEAELEDVAEPPEPGEGKGEKGKGAEGDESDEKGEGGASSAEGDEDEGGSGESSGDAEKDDEKDEDGAGEGDESEGGEEGRENGTGDAARSVLEDSADEELKTPAHDAEEGLSAAAGEAAAGETGGVPRPVPGLEDVRKPIRDRSLSERFRSDCSKHVGGLANRLAMLLRAPKPRRAPDQESGRVDSRSLSAVKTGRRRVFERRLPTVDNGVAVSILVDCSASMDCTTRDKDGNRISKTRMEMAREAAFVLGEALDRAGIAFEVCGWYERGRSSKTPPHSATPGYSRSENHFEHVVKDFGESWRRVRGRTEALPVGGNNDDAQAVWNAARRLVARRESRRVLIVLSDGHPCHYGWVGSCARQQLRDVLGYAEAAGIETAGIGINSAAVANYYENHEVAEDLSDLARASIAVLSRTLRGRRAA